MSDELSLSDLGIPAPTGDLVGQERAGCTVERLLGRGGMGAVYLARTPRGERVVLKVPAPEVTSSPVMLQRFQREWIALAKLPPHPNVVRVLRVVEDASPPLIVMELVEGVPLTRLLQEHGRVPPPLVLRAGLDLARGLALMHQHGLVHRDVKPDNALLTPTGATKLIDFGLAKDLFLSALTRSGQLLGTAAYMAPEQWEGEASPRSDVFSLGATLYHLLAGAPPFRGGDVAEVCERAQSGDFPPLPPEVPRELQRAVLKMLEPDPAFRYATMARCATDLEGVLAGRPASVPCLQDASGATLPLQQQKRFTLGRAPTCDLVLDRADVGERHAQVRRKPEGFQVVDLKSPAGTFVGEARVQGRAHTLRHGDTLRLGGAQLRFLDPENEGEVPAYLRDVTRVLVPLATLRAHMSAADPRATLALIEALAPDPGRAERARAHLARLVGPELAARAAQQMTLDQSRAAAAALARLTQLRGAPGGDLAEWLAWWDQARGTAPPQEGDDLPPLTHRLSVLGGSEPTTCEVRREGVVLLGRDPRCHLRLQAACARLHATLLRGHRRLILRDERTPDPTLLNGAPVRYAILDPGARLQLGPAVVGVEAFDAPDLGARADPLALEALAALGAPRPQLASWERLTGAS